MLRRAAYYDWFFERYGWTADMVADQPAWLLDRLPAVAAVKAEIEEERIKKAQKE